MRLEHSFVVPTEIEAAWATLTDVERVAPCMPGATLLSVDGNDFTGEVRVKLGPIGLTYALRASFAEMDAEAHRAVIDGGGKEKRGSGTAAARVTLGLQPLAGEQTRADVVIDLDITGRPAQFGRSALADVSAAIVSDFAARLAAMLSSTSDAETPPAGAPDAGNTPTSLPPPRPTADAVNLTRIALVPMMRQLSPVLAMLTVAALVVRTLSRRRT
jgi:carbon monoxide dehydrogenase subunit G